LAKGLALDWPVTLAACQWERSSHGNAENGRRIVSQHTILGEESLPWDGNRSIDVALGGISSNYGKPTFQRLT